MLLLYIALGGGLGAIARYVLGGWVQVATGATFPWGTLLINVSGSLLLGFLYVLLEGSPAAREWRAFVGIGFCGGYTTFSTFSYETARLLQDGQLGRAGTYILASALLSIAGALVGFRLASAVLGRG